MDVRVDVRCRRKEPKEFLSGSDGWSLCRGHGTGHGPYDKDWRRGSGARRRSKVEFTMKGFLRKRTGRGVCSDSGVQSQQKIVRPKEEVLWCQHEGKAYEKKINCRQ